MQLANSSEVPVTNSAACLSLVGSVEVKGPLRDLIEAIFPEG